ncbi:response regulator transcription factor [Flavobacterium lacus]|uniref:Helix-turn-helix protein n=1 Tax=Flavobacterium lacus TaxID=1353778 RepID=A0A328WTT0_9FLAO|nr:response regulator [Flavobacterium lacus]RAR47254.1 helix-turn-helix protein [Flavobacterium lacus]
MQSENYSILLIEDDLSLGQTLLDLFKSERYNVKWCKSGHEAMHYLENSVVDAIVCDLMMPGMSGEEFFLRIRKISKYDKIPFIVITANAAYDTKIRQLENGVNGYLTKPFKFQELVLKVKNIIDHSIRLTKTNDKLSPHINEKFLKKNFFKSLHAILEKNINSTIEIDEIAKELFVSKSTVFKRIKAAKDCSTSQYIREFKIRYAIRLIEEGETNVQFLADSLGFNSLSYFSICFKKYTKVSPKKYIKSISNNP